MADLALTRPHCGSAVATTSADDLVVLLDPRGNAVGAAVKRHIHNAETPFHLAVSCYVVRSDGNVLLTRRAAGKTFAGMWTNASCGHPRPDEPLVDAVRRHMAHEIGAEPVTLRLALADFAYRAEASNGVVEHELCPVFIADIGDCPLRLNPDEADDAQWISWPALVRRAERSPRSLSPWCVSQVSRLTSVFDDPIVWVNGASKAVAPVTHVHPGTDPFRRMGTDVDVVIEQFVHDAHLELTTLDPLTAELTEPILRLYRAGGKRLRPCLAYCGHAAAGTIRSPSWKDLAHLGAAIEMLHTFALLHDDVMDQSSLRRGFPTAHVWFEQVRSRSFSALGDASDRTRNEAWFGNSAAIVAGDLAFAWADELLGRLDADDATFRRVRSVYDLLRREVIAGQYLDLRLSGPCATDQQALRVALLKSARYTVTRPLQLGATLGGADNATLESLREYGDAMGIAFQLRDDVLGVFGDPAITGKGNAEDIRSGKASLLLVRALELASPTGAEVLRSCLGAYELDGPNEARCREVVLASGAVASIEALIDSQLETAMNALAGLPEDVFADLAVLAEQLTRRAS